MRNCLRDVNLVREDIVSGVGFKVSNLEIYSFGHGEELSFLKIKPVVRGENYSRPQWGILLV